MSLRQLTLQLTWACDIRCAHCCDEHRKVDLDVERAKEAMSGLHRLGEIDSLCFTGGEPFLRYGNLLELAAHGAALGMGFAVVTNARWAVDDLQVRERLAQMQAVGLDMMIASYDPYHQPFVSDDRVARLLDACAEFGVPTHIYYSRGDDKPVCDIKDEVSAHFGLGREQVSVRDVVPVGHGLDLPPAPGARSYFDIDKSCPSLDQYNIWPDGEVLPCCSAGTHEGLRLGNIGHESAEAILARRSASKLIGMLHQHDLGEIVLRLPEAVRNRLIRQHYVSACHLCLALMNDPEAREVALQLDPSTIGLTDKLLLTPVVEARLAREVRRWKGPPVVVAA
jgi:pyruvate-formate lyase-activating enzyme